VDEQFAQTGQKDPREPGSSPWAPGWFTKLFATRWTTGDLLALGVVFILVAFTLFGTLLNVGEEGRQLLGWLWNISGGDTGDSTQASMARAAWLGIAVGAITIGFLGLTLIQTRKSTEIALLATRQTLLLGQKQMRAYVSITGLSVKVADWQSDRFFYRAPVIEVAIENTGQTPAKSVAGMAELSARAIPSGGPRRTPQYV
jgi:hypothetical protein